MKKTIFTFLTLLFVYQTYSQEIVEYIVESNRNGFDITYTNDGGNTEQKKINSNKWKTTFNRNSGAFVSILAQTLNKNAEISVKIIYNGKIIEKAKSSGDYVTAIAYRFLNDEQIFANIYPYNKTFNGKMKVYSNSPILIEPNMVQSENIGLAENESVTIISKFNNGYYKVSSGNKIGYIWAGWFKE
jgi:hypothetical protein